MISLMSNTHTAESFPRILILNSFLNFLLLLPGLSLLEIYRWPPDPPDFNFQRCTLHRPQLQQICPDGLLIFSTSCLMGFDFFFIYLIQLTNDSPTLSNSSCLLTSIFSCDLVSQNWWFTKRMHLDQFLWSSLIGSSLIVFDLVLQSHLF